VGQVALAWLLSAADVVSFSSMLTLRLHEATLTRLLARFEERRKDSNGLSQIRSRRPKKSFLATASKLIIKHDFNFN
jgi:hypothetical protein